MKAAKYLIIIFTCASIALAQNNDQNTKTEQKNMKTVEDSISYAIGQNIGNSLKDPSMNINFEILMQGLNDAVVGKSIMTPEDMNNVMNTFNQRMMAQKNAAMGEVKEANKKAGDAFLLENKTKEGVKTTASGLQYKVITEGTGPKPTTTSKVKVHYKGTLTSGQVFDSSYDRGEPISFPLNGVIKGWTEGLQLMNVGSKYTFYIPSELAYGENGAGEVIQPNAVLIFDVELLGIE